MLKLFSFMGSKEKLPPKKVEDEINILVVDDDEDLLEILKAYGSPSEHIKMIYANNAEDAISIVKYNSVHGVFSDVRMVNMKLLDDFLTAQASEIPVYRFSGDCVRHLNIRLVKPFDDKEYLSVVKELAGIAKIVKNAA